MAASSCVRAPPDSSVVLKAPGWPRQSHPPCAELRVSPRDSSEHRPGPGCGGSAGQTVGTRQTRFRLWSPKLVNTAVSEGEAREQVSNVNAQLFPTEVSAMEKVEDGVREWPPRQWVIQGGDKASPRRGGF